MTELNFDFVPVLSAGNHDKPENGACVMEMVSFMNGGEWTDAPDCTLPIITGLAQMVNDHVRDEYRGDIMKDFHRLFGTSDERFAKEATEKIRSYLMSAGVFDGHHCYCSYDIETGDYITYDKVVHKAKCWHMAISFTGPSVYSFPSFEEAMAYENIRVADQSALLTLTKVLDIYDEVSGRNEYLIQDVSKLAELPGQKQRVSV